MNRRPTSERPSPEIVTGVSARGEEFDNRRDRRGSSWDPEKIMSDPVPPFQQFIDQLMAEVEAKGGQVESYTTELNSEGNWGVTVSEVPTSQTVETVSSTVGMQEEVVVTESAPFGVSSVKSEKQEAVISATGTIFDRSAKPQDVNPTETGAHANREHKS